MVFGAFLVVWLASVSSKPTSTPDTDPTTIANPKLATFDPMTTTTTEEPRRIDSELTKIPVEDIIRMLELLDMLETKRRRKPSYNSTPRSVTKIK